MDHGLPSEGPNPLMLMKELAPHLCAFSAMSIKPHCLVSRATSCVVKWLVDPRRLPHLHACPLTSTGVMRACAPGVHMLDRGILVISSLRAFPVSVQSLHASDIDWGSAGCCADVCRAGLFSPYAPRINQTVSMQSSMRGSTL